MSFPLPHASVPVVDPKTGLMTAPWLLYFAKEQVAGAAIDPVNGSSASASAKAAEAETIALQAIARHIQQQSGLHVSGIPSRPQMALDSFMPGLPPGRRQWSITKIILDTAANITLYDPALNAESLFIATDALILYYSGDGAAWTSFLSITHGTWNPTLTFGGGSTGITYAANTRFGVYEQIVTASGTWVRAYGAFLLTAKGSSTGSAAISGLPVATINATNQNVVGFVWANALNAIAGHIQAYVAPNTTSFIPSQLGTGTDAVLTDVEFSDTTHMMLSIHYKAA